MREPAIPSRPEELTAEWMSEVMGDWAEEVTVSPVGTGQTGATYRVARGNAASLIAKLSSQDAAVRERVALGYRAEHAFYTRVAATLAVPVPDCVHCAISDDAKDFVLVMDDMEPAVQGDQIKGCDDIEASLAVQALAGLHGPRWCDPEWLNFDGLTMPMADATFAAGMQELAKAALSMTLNTVGKRLKWIDCTTLEEYVELVEHWLLLRPNRYCLLHGDYRADNLLFNPDRTRVTVIDWQTLTVGLPARDLAYFLGTSLASQHRRSQEQRLVKLYHVSLVSEGVAGYDLETCWEEYCLAMLQVPFITTLGAAFSANSDRGDEMIVTMLARGCRAIRDLRTIELVKASVPEG
ncbi:phosphotransferase family protein [Rhodococcus sp. NPDC060176]|uniref:phosphotransferase family protein n=1 Tax=Rhodococcus sp. NPDC060176 TaxID=3347062 RepID=UPI003669835C